MKKLLSLLAALSLLLSLAACGEAPPEEEETPWEPFAYTLTTGEGYADETAAEDGTVVCTCHHEIPTLTAEGALSPAQQASVEHFAAAMEEVLAGSRLLYDELRETALTDYEYYHEVGLEWSGCYTDEMTCTAAAGKRAIALDFAGCTNTGGPHPGVGDVCYLFDLEAGEMVGLDAITDDDGAAFRAAIGEELLRQIQEQELAAEYFPDYEATALAQEEAEYFFRADGLTVYFPNYTLGPYAAGYPSFEIPAEVYSSTLNERGQALLTF